MIADLRRNLMIGDGSAELGRARGIDRARRAAQPAPDAAGVAFDPPRRYRFGLSTRRVRRGDSTQFQRAHRAQTLGQLAVVEPAAVPFLTFADQGVEDDR